jgi:hypothetical protein
MSRSEGELFKKLLGAAWQQLHPDIARRFCDHPAPGKPLRYKGRLSALYCSRIGKILGHLTMPLIKGALIPYADTDVPVNVAIYTKTGCDAIYKQRIYHLNHRPPIQFTSFMRETAKGEVLEYVGKGLGMKLQLHVGDDKNLYFTSDGYFWEIGGFRIPLPGILTPGKTFLCHRNDSAEQFSISIEIKHILFGTTFTQVGVFHEIHDTEGSPTEM